MKKRTFIALAAAGIMLANVLAGCGSSNSTATNTNTPVSSVSSEDDSSEESSTVNSIDVSSLPAGSVKLSVMLPLGQWTDNFDTLIDDYKKDHPEISEITATFPSSDKYNDLLVSALSANELPNIFYIGYGVRNKDWWQYAEDLSTGCPAYDLLTEEQIANGTDGDYGMIIMPIYMEGTGILYNTQILKEVGWDHTPQTRNELLQYCKDLKAKNIQPFILPWSEIYLNLFNNVGNCWLLNKEDGGKATLEKLLNGEDVDLANDEDMQDLMATYEDILIPYAQEGAISCDKWTARNAFFAEECAMLVGEGSYETPNIKNANPALLDYVKQDVLPISNTAEKNMLVKSTIGFSVSKNEDPNVVACAKDFLSFIASSEPARIWHQEVMGNPTSIQSLTVSDKLPAIAKDTIGLDQSGRAKENMFIYMPSVIYTDMEENWAKFVAQAETKEEFLTRYQKIFKDLNDGFYD